MKEQLPFGARYIGIVAGTSCQALAVPGPPTAAQAAAKAAQPYIDTELRVGALVLYYNEKAWSLN